VQSQFENRFRFGLRQRRGYRNGHPAKFSVSKTILISTVDAALHVGELKFAGGLSERDAMKGELQDFRRKVRRRAQSVRRARRSSRRFGFGCLNRTLARKAFRQ
jgi:hypothetical protein